MFTRYEDTSRHHLTEKEFVSHYRKAETLRINSAEEYDRSVKHRVFLTF